jgi:hypothetical protein
MGPQGEKESQIAAIVPNIAIARGFKPRGMVGKKEGNVRKEDAHNLTGARLRRLGRHFFPPSLGPTTSNSRTYLDTGKKFLTRKKERISR